MQACARIGAVHSVVFGGFSANAVKDRIEDAGAKLVITADGGWRGGHAGRAEARGRQGAGGGLPSPCKSVIVYRRTGGDVPHAAGPRSVVARCGRRDRASACEPEWVDAEHPLFLLYTSGSTGKPKGIQHSSAGYLLNAKLTTQVGVRPQGRRCILVHRRRRLGYRAHLCGLRAVGGGRHRAHVRGRADLSRRRAILENVPRRTASAFSTPRPPRFARS